MASVRTEPGKSVRKARLPNSRTGCRDLEQALKALSAKGANGFPDGFAVSSAPSCNATCHSQVALGEEPRRSGGRRLAQARGACGGLILAGEVRGG